MKAFVLKCRPNARFHFGEVAPDNNTSLNGSSGHLPSDTLFSALVCALAKWHEPAEVNRLIGHFEAGTVRISSGFYMLEGGNEPIWFLPKPIHYGLNVDGDFKTFAAVRFISKKVWEEGWLFEDWLTDKCVFLQQGAVVAASSEVETWLNVEKARHLNLFQINDYPRVRVHSRTSEQAFYYLTAISLPNDFQAAVHFYFLMDCPAEFEATEDYGHLLAAIRLLPHEGLGGERSNGCGLFDGVEIHDFSPPTVAGGYCTLSLSLPADDAEFARFERYQLTTRGGRKYNPNDRLPSDWHDTQPAAAIPQGQSASPKQLHFVRMLTEGAYAANPVSGKIAAIGDQYPREFLRYGKAFCLPVRSV